MNVIIRDKDGTRIKGGSTTWLAPLSRSMSDSERVSSTLRIRQKQMNTNKQLKFDSAVRSEDLRLDLDNVLYVMFPYPVAVSCIRFYNYSKNPSRGVKEFGIHLDGKDLCMGTLLPSERENQSLGGGQSVVFTSDPKIVRAEKDRINYSGGGETDVLCINERQVMVRSKSMFDKPNPVAEGIRSDLTARPSTSYKR